MNTSDESMMNRPSSIVLITNHFPFGLYESFIEKELPVLTKHFDKVIIVCRDTTSTDERQTLGASVYRVNPHSDWLENVSVVWLCIQHFAAIWKNIRTELRSLKSGNRKLTSYIVDDIVHNTVKALQTSQHLRRVLRKEELKGRVTLYSYWLTSSALATSLVSSNQAEIKRISRAHSGDVYEYRTPNKYLPFRHTLIKNLDRIFAISDDAAAHLRLQGNDALRSKIQVARLGTAPAGNSPVKSSKRLTVVSCAFLVPVKRVHLLVDALQQIDHLDIHWVHIGSGPLAEEINDHAKKWLAAKTNITYQFPGSRTNEQLMQFYRETYVDVFVNTSSAEGIPVTIMEAQSFGIPVVAPQVGGIPEIVSERTGRLFEVDASPLTVARLICDILELSAHDAKAMRQQAFQNWNTHYNAEKNFSTFVDDIQKL